MTVGQVIAKLGVDPKEYEKGLRKAETQANKAGSKIGSIFKNAFSVTLGKAMFEALKKGFKATVGTAIDFNSMLQTAQIGFATMLGSAEKAQKFLEDMADFAVKAPFEYPELLEAAKRMLAYGFAAEEVLPTLRAVGDATAALGSGSVGIDRITLALGQIRAKGKLQAEEMRQLTEAGVPAWHMLAEAMGTTVPELQKMVSKGLIPGYKAVEMLTAGMTKRFGGMMASMEDTWQGVTSSIKDIWRMTVGTLTSTLFGGLNSMLIKVRDFMAEFYSYLQGILGKKVKQSTDALADSTKTQTSAMVDLGDATEEAAKKANKNLQAFDEVHQLQEDMSDTAVGDIAVPGAGPVAPLELEDTGEPTAFSKFQEVLEKLAVLFDPAIQGFNRLKEAAQPLISNVGEGLKWFWNEVLVPFGSWVISEAIPAFFNSLGGAISFINSVLETFKPMGQWLWDNFLQPIAQWTGGVIVDVLNWLAQALTDIGNWIAKHKGLIESLAISIGIVGGTILAVNAALNGFYFIVGLVTTVVQGLSVALAFLAANPIVLIIAGITALIAGIILLIQNWDTVKAAAINCWNGIKEAWIVASTWFSENVTTPIGNFFSSTWDGIKQGASSAWDWTKKAWKNTSGWMSENVLKPTGKFFAETFKGFVNWAIDALLGIKQVFSSLGTWFRTNVTEPIGNFFKGVINVVIDALNWLIRGLNKISIGIPDWVADLLGIARGSRFGFSIGEIPRLATGTNYVPQDMLAMLHEGEAVVPKKYNPAATGLTAETIEQAVYRAFINAMRIMQASAKQDDKELVLKIDNTTLARMQLPAIIREGQRQGLNLVVQGV
jgi:tape measure domain-containing protein